MKTASLPILLAALIGAVFDPATAADPAIPSPFVAVDLQIGQTRTVRLPDGTSAVVRLVAIEETRDDVRHALREARVTVEVNGKKTTLISANYTLPTGLAGVQIDCPVVQGCVQPDNPWSLDADARIRLWPAGSPWIQPGTFVCPARQKWFASLTQMANEQTYVNGETSAAKPFYYHWGLDFGGAEGLVPVVAATDSQVVSLGDAVLESEGEETPVRSRYDVIYTRDARGWYYRYSHLQSFHPSVKLGQHVKRGERIGTLGKEGGSGGWSHLHFDITAMQPSGRYGIVEAYAFAWQACQEAQPRPLQAVARPHHLIWTGQTATLDASRTWAGKGPGAVLSCQWTFCDGSSATGAKVQRRYDRPGMFSEILKVTDDEGRVDYDFAVVLVHDRSQPTFDPPTIHAVYWPTLDIQPGDEITFKVRSFRIDPKEGEEIWDFGDGTARVATQSDGCLQTLAIDGYAVTTHRYASPGLYLVQVERRNDRGVPAITHLKVRVGSEGP